VFNSSPKLSAIADWVMALLTALGLIWLIVAYVLPASVWFEVRSIHIEDAVVGGDPVMTVDRSINRPFTADYTVAIRDAVTREVVCTSNGRTRYDTDARLPVPLTLSWWATGDDICHPSELGIGKFFAVTCWGVEPNLHILPHKHVCRESNVFEMTYVPQEGSNADLLFEQQMLKQEIQGLQNQLRELESIR